MSWPVPRGPAVRPNRSRSRRCCPRASTRIGNGAFAAARPGLAFYAGFFPRYNRLLSESGFSAEAAAVAKAWDAGDQAAAERAVTDEMLAATGIVGTAAECRERIEAYRASGLDLPIISPFARGADAKERFLAAIEACAP